MLAGHSYAYYLPFVERDTVSIIGTGGTMLIMYYEKGIMWLGVRLMICFLIKYHLSMDAYFLS